MLGIAFAQGWRQACYVSMLGKFDSFAAYDLQSDHWYDLRISGGKALYSGLDGNPGPSALLPRL
jgi:hypothetical protein